MYPKMNLSQSHGTFVASGPQKACPVSAGPFFSCHETHLHTAVTQTFIQSEARCPLISLSVHAVCS